MHCHKPLIDVLLGLWARAERWVVLRNFFTFGNVEVVELGDFDNNLEELAALVLHRGAVAVVAREENTAEVTQPARAQVWPNGGAGGEANSSTVASWLSS